jgi:hypothetical protein
MSQWALITLLSVNTTLEYMGYFGYPFAERESQSNAITGINLNILQKFCLRFLQESCKRSCARFLFRTFKRSCKALQDLARYYKILQDIARYCKILQNLARHHKILQDTARSCTIKNLAKDAFFFCKNLARYCDFARILARLLSRDIFLNIVSFQL